MPGYIQANNDGPQKECLSLFHSVIYNERIKIYVNKKPGLRIKDFLIKCD